MSISANSAFAGRQVAPNGAPFTVMYLDRGNLRLTFPDNPPPGHLDHKRTGWFWRYDDNPDKAWRGPWTGSRAAYQDAIAINARRGAAPKQKGV